MNIILYKHSSFIKRKKKKASSNFLTSQAQHLASKIGLRVEAKKNQKITENPLGRRKHTLEGHR